MSGAIVVFNAGSTSLKFAAYTVDTAGSLPLRCRGRIDSMQGDPHFVVKNAAGKPLEAHGWGEGHAIDHRTALHFIITRLETNIAEAKIVAAGHRVVLGGARFADWMPSCSPPELARTPTPCARPCAASLRGSASSWTNRRTLRTDPAFLLRTVRSPSGSFQQTRS